MRDENFRKMVWCKSWTWNRTATLTVLIRRASKINALRFIHVACDMDCKCLLHFWFVRVIPWPMWHESTVHNILDSSFGGWVSTKAPIPFSGSVLCCSTLGIIRSCPDSDFSSPHLLVTCYSNQKTLIQTGFKCTNSSCERRSRKPLSFSNRGYMSLIEIPVSRMASVQFLTHPAAGVYRLWCLVRMDRFPFSPPVVGREGRKNKKVIWLSEMWWSINPIVHTKLHVACNIFDDEEIWSELDWQDSDVLFAFFVEGL